MITNKLKAFQKALLVSFLCLISSITIAQTNTSDTKALLEHLEQRKGVVFSYDAAIISDTLVTIDTTGLSFQEIINELSITHKITFETIDDENVIIKKRLSIVNCITIIDSQTGETIPGALIKFTNSKNKYESNSDGQVSLKEKTQEVSVYSFGYITLTTTLNSNDDSNECIELILTPHINELKEVVIENYIGPGISALVTDQSLQIKQDELAIIPGETNGDVLKSISILPGISSPNTKAGNLFLRGSTPDQTVIYFDNIPLYDKGHFFGTISPFNQLVVDEVKVYRSGGHPRLGGRVGGVIDISSFSDTPDSIKTTVGSSLTSLMAYSIIPIINNKLSIGCSPIDCSHLFNNVFIIKLNFNQRRVINFLNCFGHCFRCINT